MSSQKGFTVIELMISLGILAILATIAVPSFQSVIERNRVTAQANSILSAVQSARSEAVKRGTVVRFSAQLVGGNPDITAGWCVHTGADCDTGTVIREGDTNAGVVYGGATSVGFDGRGQNVTFADVTFTLQPPDCAATTPNRQRIVLVGLSGRAQVNRGDCT